MQANKAGEATTRELQQWLEQPATSAGAGLGISIQQDLLWLENSKDLSSIALNEKAHSEKGREKRPSGGSGTGIADGGGGGTGGGGGWKSFFSCAGKRR